MSPGQLVEAHQPQTLFMCNQTQFVMPAQQQAVIESQLPPPYIFPSDDPPYPEKRQPSLGTYNWSPQLSDPFFSAAPTSCFLHVRYWYSPFVHIPCEIFLFVYLYCVLGTDGWFMALHRCRIKSRSGKYGHSRFLRRYAQFVLDRFCLTRWRYIGFSWDYSYCGSAPNVRKKLPLTYRLQSITSIRRFCGWRQQRLLDKFVLVQSSPSWLVRCSWKTAYTTSKWVLSVIRSDVMRSVRDSWRIGSAGKKTMRDCL